MLPIKRPKGRDDHPTYMMVGTTRRMPVVVCMYARAASTFTPHAPSSYPGPCLLSMQPSQPLTASCACHGI
jgi:hypothetical protein